MEDPVERFIHFVVAFALYRTFKSINRRRPKVSHDGRIFIRYIRPYILASQRHDDAPRITKKAEQAMQYLDKLIADETYHVYMMFQPGDMQFVNNYHVLHARKAYKDSLNDGQVRHLKRLWLETEVLEDRPAYFANNISHHWSKDQVISRLDAE